jgi:hypothetical protein
MKPTVPTDPSTRQNKSLVGAFIKFALAHLLVGLILQSIPFSRYPWINDFFIPIDAALPTFRTMFLISNEPLGCKVMLLCWWVLFVPWGVILGSRCSKELLLTGERRQAASFESQTWAAIRFGFLGVLGVLIVYSTGDDSSFKDYSYLLNPDRSASTIATNLRFGPFGVSWLKLATSFGILFGSFLSVLSFLAIKLYFLSNFNMKDSS